MGRGPKINHGARLKSTKRLLFRGSDMILSAAVTNVSVVTRYVPTAPLLEDTSGSFLASRGREQIEHWLETGEISLARLDPDQGFEQGGPEGGASRVLRVGNSLSQAQKVLNFHRLDPDSRVTHYQADFRREEFTPDWTTTVPAHWPANVRQGWGDEWFSSLGRHNQIIRPNNAILVLKIYPKKLEIVFNRQEHAESPSVSFLFPTAVDLPASAHETAYFRKDLAPVLFNLADAEIDGDITFAGNKHALVFRYRIPVGEFEIAVPTLTDDETQRDATLFHRWPAAKI